VEQASRNYNDHIVVPLVRYKNDIYGEGTQVTIHCSLDPTCCLVCVFNDWMCCMAMIHRWVHHCRLLFDLHPLHTQLPSRKCMSLLKELAVQANLNLAVFTAKTFQKTSYRHQCWC
jgi:hypothetical protein